MNQEEEAGSAHKGQCQPDLDSECQVSQGYTVRCSLKNHNNLEIRKKMSLLASRGAGNSAKTYFPGCYHSIICMKINQYGFPMLYCPL